MISKTWARHNHLHNLTLKTYPTSTLGKESFHSCGTRRGVNPIMIRGMLCYGLALISSRRIRRKENIVCSPWMGERCHYQLMGLFYGPMFKKPDFFRAQALGK
jgi:hypothetical protein